MATTDNQTPSLVFPIPGYTGTVSPHGAYNGGSDIMADTGSPVVSMVSGTVDFISTQSTAPNSGGNAIEIHGIDGKDYYYAHLLNPPNIGVGGKVVAGQQIGQVDTTGNAKGGPSHLHLGIGYGITTGVRTSADPSAGGLGKNFDAVAMLRALVKDPRANDPALVGANPNPPEIQFVPNVPGFDSQHANDIKLNIERALAAGIDPFLWLGIVSVESNFNPNAVNPSSGACGYAQIYPCVPLSPSDNIDEGIKRLKGFLSTCNNNVNCALNLYSGGGGPLYASDVQNRAKAIQGANPKIATGGFSIPTIGGTVGTPGADTNVVPPEDCPPIKFGTIGPAEIKIPNPVCIVQYALKTTVTNMSNWFGQWQTEHVPAWTFVILGIVLIIIGGLALANSAGVQPPTIPVASGAAEATAGAPELAEVAAVL
jgi:hypothetical protein